MLHGFTHNNFVYLVIVQPVAEEDYSAARMETRLGRICANDSNFDTYSEIVLQCQSKFKATPFVEALTAASGRGQHNAPLYVAFSALDGSTAICEFSIKQIDEQFQNAICQCKTVGLERFDAICGKKLVCEPQSLKQNLNCTSDLWFMLYRKPLVGNYLFILYNGKCAHKLI